MIASATIAGLLDDFVSTNNPDLWLILADYLEEQQDPRAQLVRLTYQFNYQPDTEDLQQEIQQLLERGLRPLWPTRTVGGISFVWVPPGRLLECEPPTWWAGHESDEIKDGFWIGQYPITQQQFKKCIWPNRNPSYFQRSNRAEHIRRKLSLFSEDEIDNFPVESVSYLEVINFCKWFSELYRVRGNLPNELEWKYACRAGSVSPFHFGELPQPWRLNCRFEESSDGGNWGCPNPVGTYPPNFWGLYDMHGNVAEFCCCEESPATTVVKGGSFADFSYLCQSDSRDHTPTERKSMSVGFRVCFRD
jgi:uncharacterized protein (TIGR02996 family)